MNVVSSLSGVHQTPATAAVLLKNNAATLPDFDNYVQLPKSTNNSYSEQQKLKSGRRSHSYLLARCLAMCPSNNADITFEAEYHEELSPVYKPPQFPRGMKGYYIANNAPPKSRRPGKMLSDCLTLLPIFRPFIQTSVVALLEHVVGTRSQILLLIRETQPKCRWMKALQLRKDFSSTMEASTSGMLVQPTQAPGHIHNFRQRQERLTIGSVYQTSKNKSQDHSPLLRHSMAPHLKK